MCASVCVCLHLAVCMCVCVCVHISRALFLAAKLHQRSLPSLHQRSLRRPSSSLSLSLLLSLSSSCSLFPPLALSLSASWSLAQTEIQQQLTQLCVCAPLHQTEILQQLTQLDKEGRHAVIIYKAFSFEEHYVIVTELLGRRCRVVCGACAVELGFSLLQYWEPCTVFKCS